jgi:hypothetical protein
MAKRSTELSLFNDEKISVVSSIQNFNDIGKSLYRLFADVYGTSKQTQQRDISNTGMSQP